jgi:hypothetical protein
MINKYKQTMNVFDFLKKIAKKSSQNCRLIT